MKALLRWNGLVVVDHQTEVPGTRARGGQQGEEEEHGAVVGVYMVLAALQHSSYHSS